MVDALDQVEVLTDIRASLAVVERGYRRHGVTRTRVLISGMRKGITPMLLKLLRRRNDMEAEIGRIKTDGRLTRCPPQGHARRCDLCYPMRLRPQHPQDTDPPTGRFGAVHRSYSQRHLAASRPSDHTRHHLKGVFRVSYLYLDKLCN
jgi:hypothetical protein